MEPMTLGSAPSSPASPSINPNFLPGFLMGEQHQTTTPNLSSSPGRNKTPTSTYKMGPASSNEPQSLRQKLFTQSMSDSPAAHSPFMSVSEKAGPPKMGLFDSLEQSKKGNTSVTSPIMSSTVASMNDSMVVGFNQSSLSRINPEDSMNCTRNFTNANESFNRSSNFNTSRIDSYWVTVFGFPPSALAVVLSHISNCGVIADKKVPSVGNWVHVKFNNYAEVARALTLNGKCINNSIMIGVHIFHEHKENKENLNNTAVYTTPSRARSLRHSFVSPQAANMVVSPQAVPQKSTGIVTKAMEYVFGW